CNPRLRREFTGRVWPQGNIIPEGDKAGRSTGLPPNSADPRVELADRSSIAGAQLRISRIEPDIPGDPPGARALLTRGKLRNNRDTLNAVERKRAVRRFSGFYASVARDSDLSPIHALGSRS